MDTPLTHVCVHSRSSPKAPKQCQQRVHGGVTQHACGAQLYMYQMLKAVSFAHARRVIHRDLKPQNILVDRASNTVKVADFGLARCFTPPIRPYTHEARPMEHSLYVV